MTGRRLVLLGLGGGRLGHIGLMVGGRRLLDTGHVPGRINGCDERVDRHERRVVADGGGLGGEVDVRLGDPLHPAQEAGDAVDA